MNKCQRVPKSRRRSGNLFFALLAFVLITSGCSVTLISAYDEQIDRSATSLQKEMDTFLSRLETANDSATTSYDQNRAFYTDHGVGLRGLLVRARSHEKNEISITQIELMVANLEELRESHESGPLSPESIGVFRDLFNQGWGAILKLELAKKRVL